MGRHMTHHPKGRSNAPRGKPSRKLRGKGARDHWKRRQRKQERRNALSKQIGRTMPIVLWED